MYNNSTSIGNIGETSAIFQFTKRNIPVSVPFGQNTPYDLIIQIKGKLYKIQCKTAQYCQSDKMVFHITRTNGFTCSHIPYSNNEIDFFYLYCIENGYCGLMSIIESPIYEINLRLTKPKNNQSHNIKYAKDYELDVQLHKLLYNNMVKPFTIFQ